MKEFFFTYIFPSVFIFGGLGVFCRGVWLWRVSVASRAWPSVVGTIRESRVEERSGMENSTAFDAVISYDYEADGNAHSGSKISFMDLSTNRRIDAERLVMQYPAGTSVRVYYDPTKCGRSVLEPGPTDGVWFWMGVGAVFCGAGVMFAFLLPYYFRGIAG